MKMGVEGSKRRTTATLSNGCNCCVVSHVSPRWVQGSMDWRRVALAGRRYRWVARGGDLRANDADEEETVFMWSRWLDDGAGRDLRVYYYARKDRAVFVVGRAYSGARQRGVGDEGAEGECNEGKTRIDARYSREEGGRNLSHWIWRDDLGRWI
uniref:Uncharacterized protein n=1 Tax=Oryza punctata TaxID=4537 RepID=A0A0E0LTV2_ORYPU